MKKTLNTAAIQTLTAWVKSTHKTPRIVCIDRVIKQVETSLKRGGLGFVELSKWETVSGDVEALTFNACDFN